MAFPALILLADDEFLLRYSSQCLLEQEGYRVEVAEDGAECVERYRQLGPENVALVILDQRMPVMTGREAFRQIRAINPSAKVLLSSGSIEGTQLSALREEGLWDAIFKPFNVTHFLAKVASAVSSSDPLPIGA